MISQVSLACSLGTQANIARIVAIANPAVFLLTVGAKRILSSVQQACPPRRCTTFPIRISGQMQFHELLLALDLRHPQCEVPCSRTKKRRKEVPFNRT